MYSRCDCGGGRLSTDVEADEEFVFLFAVAPGGRARGAVWRGLYPSADFGQLKRGPLARRLVADYRGIQTDRISARDGDVRPDVDHDGSVRILLVERVLRAEHLGTWLDVWRRDEIVNWVGLRRARENGGAQEKPSDERLDFSPRTVPRIKIAWNHDPPRVH